VLARAVAFLVVFALVLLAATHLYLLPAFRAAKDADDAQRRQLATSATLVLAVVLFVLFAGLVLTFRVSRYFFPRPPVVRAKPTEYVDAWAEAGRRMTAAAEDEKD
jgi:heme/copper-type cytochrome/quinol oxidase subunit 2